MPSFSLTGKVPEVVYRILPAETAATPRPQSQIIGNRRSRRGLSIRSPGFRHRLKRIAPSTVIGWAAIRRRIMISGRT
ncbi:MAG: hypothetical protein EOR78_30610 [Mesorhizobium sp.]|nr:hypothetical protein EOA85_32715 [Mesorhizobium sp. M5C.F.Ca.IN.020.29.1.1]RWA97535.1 MAG: hypothetical protein EOQ33_31150 [Mesorhizobium sp.]TGT92907.1 hypothetical protein EN807_30070 [Mesorhizobium sp. M5C.F.Ca.ET.164.01.1.1]RWC22970.1 MAG: hypothetical protein EOS51_09195 [Mesorhizobium sp.]RWD77644.1 MAG: hypothetical protein EOS48_28215 [Mesorhizobium sp.]